MKKLWTLIVLVMATVSLAACSLFQGKSIDGEWTSPTAGEEILQLALEEAEVEDVFVYSGHSFSEVVPSAVVDLSIKEDKATMVVTLSVDREALFVAMKDEFSMTSEAALAEEGLTYDQLTDDEKSLYDSFMFSDDMLYELADEIFNQMAEGMNGSYDAEAGEVSAKIFKGTVNRSKKLITMEEVNGSTGYEDNDFQTYTFKDGNTLILDGATDGEDMVFNLKK